MLDLFNIAKPQGCDIQTFYGAGGTPTQNQRSWMKPRGVSHIYMMLISGGGDGNGVDQGGGSGAVTVWYGAAQHVPDSLVVSPSRGSGSATTVSARVSNSSAAPGALLTANASSGSTGATAMTANQFTASGFFQSIAGQAGAIGPISPSNTTFLSGGSPTGIVTTNYGYTLNSGGGIFMLQPIIVGSGGISMANGGIGCGGGETGKGGPGLVLIASW